MPEAGPRKPVAPAAYPTDAAQDVLMSRFRHLMRQMAATVAVVATEHDGQWFGMAASSVVSLSMEPPALIFCVNRSASIYRPLLERGAACVNLLSEERAQLCAVFSGKEKSSARFRHGAWSAGHRGLPCLTDAVGQIVVSVREAFTHGTHAVFVGDVEKVSVGCGRPPLVYLDGSFITQCD